MTNANDNSRTLTAVSPDIFEIFLLDEDGQNILSIDDGALRQSLRIEIINTSGRNIEFTELQTIENIENYHFSISFRPGTLLLNPNGDTNITLEEADQGWQQQYKNNTFYIISSQPRTIESGKRITLTLKNIGAAPEGGSRGTRVEIKYNNLQYEGSNEVISGNRLQYLNIVNQRGKKQIPLYVGFLGSNTILNDGSENELTLTIQSLPNQNSQLRILETPEIKTIDSTTRWQGNLLKFLEEKVPNFRTEIDTIIQDPNISTARRTFFEGLRNLQDTEASFAQFQASLRELTFNDNDKRIIFTILLSNLGVIIEEDLNAILTQLKSLLYPVEPTPQELERIRGIILQIIQSSDNFRVIKSELNPEGRLEFKGLDAAGFLDRAAKFSISFDVTTTEDNDSKNWALVDKKNADDIQIDIVRGQENWIFGGIEEQGITPRWSFICKQGLQLQARTEILRFSISNLKTQLLSGYANLYVHYENIPGYWDGYITVPIHKGPLVYREKTFKNVKVGCIGIGTDEPQAKLHVKSSNGFDGLRVDGIVRSDVFRTLSDSWEIARNGHNLEIREPEQSNKVWARFTDDQSFHLIGTPNLWVDGKVGIGTSNPGSNKLKVKGDTTIAGNLFITNGKVGIGTSNPDSNQLKVKGDTTIAGKLEVVEGTTTLEQEKWRLAKLENGWKNHEATVAYFKDSMGIVHLKGRAFRDRPSNTSPQTTLIFRLPEGYRTNELHWYLNQDYYNIEPSTRPRPDNWPHLISITIDSDGNVKNPFAQHDYVRVSFSGITFRAEA
ncbi:MAG: hypothetical protein QNJ54_21915 [Prochloraceae cyanobacterium]|nr:hypothetical protein [Prochloraceae cyanobacterium]